jgi:histidinol-phosphatase (PHP family)
MIADHHIHTHLCGHAEGAPRAYVERAISLGMTEIGFADHLPFLGGWQPSHPTADDWSMSIAEMDGYVELVQGLAHEYATDLRIALGIEADYIEKTLDETAAVLAQYPFDYVIGSVHIMSDGFPFDHPAMRHALVDYGIDRIYLDSLELVTRAAESKLFHVMGHIDHVKKFGHAPSNASAVSAAAARALRAIAAAGAAIELNTAGYRKPVGEAFPAPNLLAQAAQLGIPLTFGSDAHRPAEVGADFERAAGVARQAGYSSVLRFAGGLTQEPL